MSYFDSVALPLVLIFEGNFSDDKNDRGGRTNKGITQVVYDKYRQSKNSSLNDVKNITDSEVADIYLNNYWLPSKCDKMGDKLATVVFDTSVNNGQGSSARFLQRTVGAKIDGVIGPKTLLKLSSMNQDQIVDGFLLNRINFYKAIVLRDPSQSKFLDGWLRRINFLKDFINGIKTLDQIRSSW